MSNYRKYELFSENNAKINISVSNCPPFFYKQERDWTCAFACIRTIMSYSQQKWLSEDDIIKKYRLSPKPYFSSDVKKLGILNDVKAIYGCDKLNVDFSQIINYMNSGYFIMLESLINYSHWMVLVGCYAFDNKKGSEYIKLLFYDPYYNDIRIILLDEFINMWIDGNYANNNVEKDFIAIKPNKMNWKYVKPLKSIKNIDDFECLVKYVFPEEFRKCVIENNGGRPELCCFNTDKVKERALKSFLSFNKNDRETVWKLYEWSKDELADKYVPFAIDNFGNLICFNVDNDHIVFINHESLSIEFINSTFEEFVNSLY